MADSTRNIRIDDSNNSEPDFEGSAIPVLDDDDAVRPTINLDDVGDLQDAVNAATRGTRSAPQGAESADVEKLRVELEEAKQQAKQAQDNYMRSLADIQNMRRRTDEERLRIIRDGNERLIKELLPVVDDFDKALEAAKRSEGSDQLITGVEAIFRKLMDLLAKQGVEPIAAVGQPFDPEVHEAVMVDEETDQPDETVTAEMRRGYTLNGRVIRASMVKVSKG